MNTTTHSPDTTIAQHAINRLCRAFEQQDVSALLDCFTQETPATYAGSETGEIATGPDQLAMLFTELLNLPQRYEFHFTDIRVHPHASSIAVLADGHGCEIHPTAGNTETFRYRISGTLVLESSTWVWAILSGSEPTAPPTP